MDETVTPLQGMPTMEMTQEMQTHAPLLKRLRLWGLVAFAVFLVLWEIDKQCGGVVFTYFAIALAWTMNHAVFPGAVGVLLGHYCWPRTLRLLPSRKSERHESL